MAEQWPFIGSLVRGVVTIFKTLFDLFITIAEFVGTVFLNSIQAAFQIIGGIVGGFLDGIQGVFNIIGKIGKKIGLGGGDVLQEADANPLNAQSEQAISNTSKSVNRNTSVSVGEVNVNAPGADSAEISAGIGSALKDEMQSTVSNFDDGVAM